MDDPAGIGRVVTVVLAAIYAVLALVSSGAIGYWASLERAPVRMKIAVTVALSVIWPVVWLVVLGSAVARLIGADA